MNIFVWKWSKIAAQKKVIFFADFALVHPPMASVLLSALVERCFVSRMRNFFCERCRITHMSWWIFGVLRPSFSNSFSLFSTTIHRPIIHALTILLFILCPLSGLLFAWYQSQKIYAQLWVLIGNEGKYII